MKPADLVGRLLEDAQKADLSAREQKLLDLVLASMVERGKGKAVVTAVERRSGREFDVGVEGNYGSEQFQFSAWLPLAAIHGLTNWPGLADMTDYPEMTEAGDWSGVRDSSDEAKWAIFDQHVLPQLQ